MAIKSNKIPAAESLATISNVLLSAFIIATLFLGRELLVPLALAALLTFMLSPLVSRLQHYIGKIGAVLVVVLMIMASTGLAGWVLTRQMVDLAEQLPKHKSNIQTKLQSIRFPSGGPFARISDTWQELKEELPEVDPVKLEIVENLGRIATREPVPVKMVSGKDERLEFIQIILAPILGPLGNAALVLLLLIFMLLQRDDLRNRLIRLIGQGRISATTRAMDDAGSRVSKYLLMQLIVNVSYGIAVSIGLYFIGVPNAVLWGTLAAVLRFIPYVGPWIAAAFPIILSLAVSPHWLIPLYTISLFVVLELFSNNVMEPWLYGSSTGVTPIALIIAALVWTWLWGPVGLVLATPLTVCLVVMGRHIPKLAFLSVLLSDDEPLTPAEDCYHRLQRVGEHDEMDLVENYLKTNSTAALFDAVLLPVVTAAETDHRLGIIEREEVDIIKQGIADILDDLESRLNERLASRAVEEELGVKVCCLPAKAYRDQLASIMAAQCLREKGAHVVNASAKMLSGEFTDWVREANPDIVCISAIPPTTLLHARHLCSKLRTAFPHLRIIVGLWGNVDQTPESLKSLQDAGADIIVTSVNHLLELIHKR